MNLKIDPNSDDHITFSKPIFPQSEIYFDRSLNKKVDVFSDDFTVYIPFKVGSVESEIDSVIKIDIDGAVCSDIQCRMPDFGQLVTKIQISPTAEMQNPRFILPVQESTNQRSDLSIWVALLLAFLAGLSLNIMPCVWPILPLIVMRLVEQANQNKRRTIIMGLAFCLGILLFFAALAGANIILQVFYGMVLQWGDQFRSPGFVAAMAILLVVLALFMFGVFTIGLPASIAGKSASGKGYGGAIGMGFLAAVLSTPCSFAILAAAFAWAQAQPLLPATIAIMVIGLGMALPYAILTSLPGLLKSLPRSGRWMELFKQTVGFILLVVAIKLIAALPTDRQMNVLYFSVILSFALWMWAGWVNYNTKLHRKLIIRIIAIALVVGGGWIFLSQPAAELIAWQKYDAEKIEKSIKDDRPVLIKFTADWCMSCQVVEKTVYGRKDIANLIEKNNVLAIKADTTARDYPATIALKDIYNEPGVPVSLFFVPGTAEPIRWRNIFFGDQLKTALEKLNTDQ
jgi:thiol:disulfide interchange protein DsbD